MRGASGRAGLLERGQFMSGACAGLISKVLKLPSFHRELAEGPLLLHQPFEGVIERMPGPLPGASHPVEAPSSVIGRGLEHAAPHRFAHERVAITGMGILNALGKDPEEVWASKPGHEKRDYPGSAFPVGSQAFL